MAEIVIIGAQWLPRVLLRAELEERGHVVTGFAALGEAMPALGISLVAPDLLILDTVGENLDPATLARFRQVVGGKPVLILSGPFDAARLDFSAIGFANVLLRPIMVGRVVARAEQLLRAR